MEKEIMSVDIQELRRMRKEFDKAAEKYQGNHASLREFIGKRQMRNVVGVIFIGIPTALVTEATKDILPVIPITLLSFAAYLFGRMHALKNVSTWSIELDREALKGGR